MIIYGKWYSEGSSRSTLAKVQIHGETVMISAEGSNEPLVDTVLNNVEVSDRLGNTPRYLSITGQGQLETSDNDAVDEWIKASKGGRSFNWLHTIESRLHYVLAAFVIVFITFGVTIKYGVPAASNVIAKSLPQSLLNQSSREILVLMDVRMFEETKLSDQKKQEVLQHFEPLVQAHKDLNIEVLFRSSEKIGANAFALPDGTVIFTDQMVALAEHPDELVSVLAHEIGHVEERHSMRSIVQNAFFVFLIASIFGDVSATADIVLAIPILFTELAYSRKYELEADHYAKEWMIAHDIPLSRFSDLMRRVEKQHMESEEQDPENEQVSQTSEADNAEEYSMDRWLEYLSTHPHMDKRLQAFENSEP